MKFIIVRDDTVYGIPDTGETTIVFLNEAILVGDKMEQTIVNSNQIHYYGVTVQGNSFPNAPKFISMEDYRFVLTMMIKGKVIVVFIITPTYQELHTFPHIIILL